MAIQRYGADMARDTTFPFDTKLWDSVPDEPSEPITHVWIRRRDVLIPVERHVVIGSGRRCDIVIDDDPYVSRVHCEIALDPDHGPYLVDHSTNGTYINGMRVERIYLLAGARWRMGATDGAFLGASRRIDISGPTYSRVMLAALRWYLTPAQTAKRFCGPTKDTWYRWRKKGLPERLRSHYRSKSS